VGGTVVDKPSYSQKIRCSFAHWRKRVGIEPTAAGVSRQPDGFEGRASHQTRIASAGRLV